MSAWFPSFEFAHRGMLIVNINISDRLLHITTLFLSQVISPTLFFLLSIHTPIPLSTDYKILLAYLR